jgi:hypothetical protein
MSWSVYGLLVIFGAFIFLLIRHPSLSCFGRKLKSPFYPVFRRKRMERDAQRVRQARLKKLPTTDYGFKLDDEAGPARPGPSAEAKKKAEDYGFKLDDET